MHHVARVLLPASARLRSISICVLAAIALAPLGPELAMLERDASTPPDAAALQRAHAVAMPPLAPGLELERAETVVWRVGEVEDFDRAIVYTHETHYVIRVLELDGAGVSRAAIQIRAYSNERFDPKQDATEARPALERGWYIITSSNGRDFEYEGSVGPRIPASRLHLELKRRLSDELSAHLDPHEDPEIAALRPYDLPAAHHEFRFESSRFFERELEQSHTLETVRGEARALDYVHTVDYRIETERFDNRRTQPRHPSRIRVRPMRPPIERHEGVGRRTTTTSHDWRYQRSVETFDSIGTRGRRHSVRTESTLQRRMR